MAYNKYVGSMLAHGQPSIALQDISQQVFSKVPSGNTATQFISANHHEESTKMTNHER